jgi:hypothetical protein
VKSRRELNLTSSHAGRLRALWQFIGTRGHGLRYEIERRDDPGPGLFEWRRRAFGR